MKDREHSVGKRFLLTKDTHFSGGREEVSGMIRAGTEVEVISVGVTQVCVKVVDYPLGHLSLWVHGNIALSAVQTVAHSA